MVGHSKKSFSLEGGWVTHTSVRQLRSTGGVHPIPTIKDVALAAGVSIGTASKALNGQGQLRDETRRRVRAVAEELGYQPNDLAQSLHRKRTFMVGLISTDNYGRFSMPLLEGIEHALGTAELSVFLCNAADDSERERRHVASLLSKRVDGIIVTANRTDPRPPLDLLGSRVPVLYALARVPDDSALCLVPDDAQGARLAAEHLVGLGRRRIAHVTGPRDYEVVGLRQEAVREVLVAAGLAFPERRVLSGPWRATWGRAAAERLLSTDPDIDAVFCGSDEIALGLTGALRERGVRVPDDIAVVGFDNWEIIAEATVPPLTSVDMRLRDLGHEAATALLGLIDGERRQGVHRLPCDLVVRASSGAAGGAS